MGPWDDPGYLALAAGDAPGLEEEPPIPPLERVAASGLLGIVEEGPPPSPVAFLGSAPQGRTLAVVSRCLQEARRGRYRTHGARALLFARAAWAAAEYLDVAALGAARVARVVLAVRREVANAHRLCGELSRAAAGLRQAREILRAQGRDGDPCEQGEQAAYEAAVLTSRGRWPEALEQLEGAVEAVPAGSSLALRLQVQAGVLAGWSDPGRARLVLRSALEGIDAGTPTLRRIADLALTWWETMGEGPGTGEDAPVLRRLDRLRPRVLAVEDPWSHAALLWVEARLLVRAGLLTEADAAYNRLWTRLFELDHRPELIQVTGELLVVLVRRGRLPLARQVHASVENLFAAWHRPLVHSLEWQRLRDVLEKPEELEGAVQRLVRNLRRSWWHRRDRLRFSGGG